ncbi:MAG TPA: 4-hydroxyphenylacetate 3-monooxygenase, oxygenase component [Gammaproteobacteria bacterium]|jgi:4-hydroxyphenylacetate 3-monooxygenase|nr:4-hydroxyphenylacetate 3-monooxygenase, oxygenase component [Gammaproteobacteria bacterium]
MSAAGRPLATGRAGGARRGADVLARLKERPPALWYAGEPVANVTTHPAFRGGVATLAELYDLQWEQAQNCLFESPSSGLEVGRAFLLPRTRAELEGVTAAMRVWAQHTHGMMGRVPDYLSRAMSGFAAGAAFLGAAEPRFGTNALRLHAELREHDLCLTHSLLTPQINRAVGPSQQADPFLAARVRSENDAGIVLRGARMLATLPMADAIMVFPSTLLKNTPEDAPYAFGVIIPTDAPGLRFLCRESVDCGRPPPDHPLGSRFEEMDAVVVFDDVHVPWENVLLYRDVERCNSAYARTGAAAGMAHQVVVKNVAKAEFVLGLAHLLVDSIGVEGFQHVQEKLAEIWVTLETMRAFLRAAEADAAPDEFGVVRPAWNPLDAARNLFPRLYPRLVEILQQIGASGLVAMPTAADIDGPLAADIRRYYQAARADALERIPLFRLAWDTALSAFAGRQVLYERFFFGDPVRMAGALVTAHAAEIRGYADRVREILRTARDMPPDPT